jgi:hypothetical protein
MTNENQKPTTDQYRKNWDEIFDSSLEETKEKSITVDVEAENGDASVTITKTWNF